METVNGLAVPSKRAGRDPPAGWEAVDRPRVKEYPELWM